MFDERYAEDGATPVTFSARYTAALVVAFWLYEGVRAGAQTPPVEALAVVVAVAPDFPDIAAQARISKRFTVDVVIGPSGAPLSVEMKPAFFKKPVETAAMAWRFSPSPTIAERHITLAFTFTLLPTGSPPEEQGAAFTPPYSVEVRRSAPPMPTVNRDPRPTLIK